MQLLLGPAPKGKQPPGWPGPEMTCLSGRCTKSSLNATTSTMSPFVSFHMILISFSPGININLDSLLGLNLRVCTTWPTYMDEIQRTVAHNLYPRATVSSSPWPHANQPYRLPLSILALIIIFALARYLNLY